MSVGVPAVRRRSRMMRLTRVVWPRNDALRTSIIILIGLVIFAILGKFFLVDPTKQVLHDSNLHPGSPGHLLGTDPLGRDILAWCAAGVLTSLAICGLGLWLMARPATVYT